MMGGRLIPNLSICVPTYDRDPFLQWTLDKTVADFPDAKVIVSDNGKTKVVPPGRYIRQGTNIGAFPNMRAALLAASTKYCVYLGDDDYMLPAEVYKGVEFLEANPEVAIYFAPCQLYDQVNDKSEWDAFYVAEDRTITKPEDLWNFVIQNHVWPEHAIYRRKGLEAILHPRLRAYWCFADLANAFAQGPVHFAKMPYYRNITNHPVGPRGKLGDAQCLTDFDQYQFGLEVLAHDLFINHLEQPDLKRNVNAQIRQFLYARVEVAHRILLAQNRHAEAAEYHKRLTIWR
jgi:glycosyltransferase involved in cell wall biosynthesis